MNTQKAFAAPSASTRHATGHNDLSDSFKQWVVGIIFFEFSTLMMFSQINCIFLQKNMGFFSKSFFHDLFFIDRNDRTPVQRFSRLLRRSSSPSLLYWSFETVDGFEDEIVVLPMDCFDIVREWSTGDWIEARNRVELRVLASMFRVENLVVEPLDEVSFQLHFELRCSQPLACPCRTGAHLLAH